MAKKQENYFKELKDLTIEELFCYGVGLGIQKPTSMQRKNDIIKMIVQKDANFLNNTNKKFYFSKTDNKLQYYATPTTPENFHQKTITAASQVKVEDLKKEIEEEKADSISESSIDLSQFDVKDDCIQNRPDADNDADIDSNFLLNLINTANNQKSKGFLFKPKLKYEPTHGIEAFIRSVEDYARANDVTDTKKWVAVAKSALNQSEDGLLIQDSLLPEEENDWILFKCKLQSILGRAADYYRDSVRSIRCGSLILKIICLL